MQYYTIKAKFITLLVAQAIVKHFIIPVTKATATSVKATLSLPHTIITAIEEARESARLESEMDAALIDPTFLDRAAMGLTEEESKTIKDLAKGL